MNAQLVTVAQFRAYSGASSAALSDDLVQAFLDEAEAGIVAKLGVGVAEIQSVAEAESKAKGEELRSASRLLARRNSPEAIAGAGEMGIIPIPVRDPDSGDSIWAIACLLGITPALA